MVENDKEGGIQETPEDIIAPLFVKTEDVAEIKKEKVNYSTIYELPSLKTRFFSMLIDGVCILLMAYGLSVLFSAIGEVPGFVRGITFALFLVLYEPILISLGCTIGQSFMNIRVRSFRNPEKKLNFLFGLARFTIKILLGWLSFITVTFNENRRAIHDMASGSIMIVVTQA